MVVIAMALRIGDEAPDFTADTTEGRITFHDWIGSGWALLFSHPKDFTPVCTTELGACDGLVGEFKKAGIKLIERLGGEIAGCAFVIDLPELGGRDRLEKLGMSLVTLCAFEGT